MALIPCHFCQVQLEIPLPEEGGPPFGTPLQCSECGEAFTLGEQPASGEQPPVSGLQLAASYSDAMLTEQLQAEQERQLRYDERLVPMDGVESKPNLGERIKQGLFGMIGSLARVTSGFLVFLALIALLIMIFIIGWLVGDDVNGLIGSFLRQFD